jgi:putative tryptophan/tyrosine transport system substrate-binding protein
MPDMRRRQFLTLLGGAAAWPLAARAQQPVMQLGGWLSARSPREAEHVLQAFLQGLNEAGYFEGKNVKIEYRWAEGHYDRLPALAAELVQHQVAVIAATGGEPSPLAAKAATISIPIVFTAGGDPVEAGLVASLNQPGGNITGTTIMGIEMGPKRLDLVRQLVPNASSVAMLVNPKFPLGSAEARDVQGATRSLGMRFHVLFASTEAEVDAAFRDIVEQKMDLLIIATDPFLLGQRDQVVGLAARYAVPTMYFLREFVEAGGLMSYGPDIANGYRQAGVYTGRILSGAKPATLPVWRPTHFLLVLNLKTAKALGLDVPDRLLALADEVIE